MASRGDIIQNVRAGERASGHLLYRSGHSRTKCQKKKRSKGWGGVGVVAIAKAKTIPSGGEESVGRVKKGGTLTATANSKRGGIELRGLHGGKTFTLNSHQREGTGRRNNSDASNKKRRRRKVVSITGLKK